MKILLIEDEIGLRGVLQDILSGIGYDVVATLDMDEVKKSIPIVDLIISDYNMGLDFQVIRGLAQEHEKPLILMSGNSNVDEDTHPNFIRKPFPLAELLTKCGSWEVAVKETAKLEAQQARH